MPFTWEVQSFTPLCKHCLNFFLINCEKFFNGSKSEPLETDFNHISTKNELTGTYLFITHLRFIKNIFNIRESLT